MNPELWLRPWARSRSEHRRTLDVGGGLIDAPEVHRAPLWVYQPAGRLSVDGQTQDAELHPGFTREGEARTLSLLPLPLRRGQEMELTWRGGRARLRFPQALDRPRSSLIAQTEDERAAHSLMLRAEMVWDRLRDVEIALGDPARLWEELSRRWMGQHQDAPPQMDVIVEHARSLHRTLDDLGRRPRHVLRRTHARTPIARVQEFDRRSMLWLARQPGETLAERAGDEQRVLAVVRYESVDTLENRVLRAYAELASYRARDYLERNSTRRLTRRAMLVEGFGQRCKRLSQNLKERGVTLVEPGVTPNFVLQQNWAYRSIWDGWLELLRQERRRDDLWRWQQRSWEEFCGLAAMVALSEYPGARIVATAPLDFREEQRHGSWVRHDNPLGVVHLPRTGIVAEVRSRMAAPERWLSDHGATVSVRIGRVGDALGFLATVPIWPVWDVHGGLVADEAEEVAECLGMAPSAMQIRGGVVLRPAPPNAQTSERRSHRRVLTIALGAEGTALREGLETLRDWLARLLDAAAGS